MGQLSKLAKDEDNLSLTGAQKEMLDKFIKNYYYQNKKMNSGAFALGKIAENFSELSGYIKA